MRGIKKGEGNNKNSCKPKLPLEKRNVPSECVLMRGSFIIGCFALSPSHKFNNAK